MIRLEAKEIVLSIGLPITLSICFIILGNWMLPSDCTLFGTNLPGPQSCHTLPAIDNCYDSFCKNVDSMFVASRIVGFGFFLILVPIIIHLLKKFYDRPFQKTKLFD